MAIEGMMDQTRSPEYADAVFRIISELSSSMDLDQTLHQALALMQDLLPSDYRAILLRTSPEGQLKLRSTHTSQTVSEKHRISSYESLAKQLAEWVVEERQAHVLTDLQQNPPASLRSVPNKGIHCAIAVPVLVGEVARGALIVLDATQGSLTDAQLPQAVAVAKQIGSALNNTELYSLIRDQAERLGSMLRTQQIESSKSRAILESIANGVIVTDPGHTILLFNAAAERILRLNREEVAGEPAATLIGMYGAAGHRWLDAVESWSDATPAQDTHPIFEEQLELDGERVISVRLAPVILDNEFLGTVSIIRDISREIEVDRLKSEFVATVSHELRTPMTSIKGYVDVLLMGAVGTLTDEQRRFLEIVRNNTARLGALVNDLLDISGIESGKIELAFQALEVRELLDDMERYIHDRLALEDKAMQVEIQVPDELPSIYGDAESVHQILRNLINNSLNYTPAGGTIALEARTRDNEVEIEVRDNGIGIPPEDQGRVFDRFFRGEQALELGVSGTGLGLSIALNLVEMHGGRIWMSSDGVPGRGSTFTVALPSSEAGANRARR